MGKTDDLIAVLAALWIGFCLGNIFQILVGS